MPTELPSKPGYYRDPSNGDMWHRSNRGGWSWINGGRWRFIPEGLVWTGEPNPYHPEASERPADKENPA